MSKHYAQLNAENIVIGISQLSGEVQNPALVEIPENDPSLIGQQYAPDTGEFSPAPEVAPEPIRKITKGAFYSRFTLAEAIALEGSADPVVAVLKKRLDYRSHVNLDFPETIDGMNYLVQSGEFPDFDANRKAAMLADGAPDEEFKGAQ